MKFHVTKPKSHLLLFLRRGPSLTTKPAITSRIFLNHSSHSRTHAHNSISHLNESDMALAASSSAARPVMCQLRAEKAAVVPEPSEVASPIQKLKLPDLILGKTSNNVSNNNIVMQPRVCTLRSFGDEPVIIKSSNDGNEVSRFFDTLSDYIESSKKSHDFEIISGRFAMIVFAATLGVEAVTGNSVFRKMDLQGIEEALGVCFAAITSAAIFAWCSSNRKRVGSMFTVGCNTFIDSLIDQIIDGLFYDADVSDWSDDL